LKGYHEWKLSGGVGVWRYGGTVRITSFPKGTPSSSILGSESAEESLDESQSSQYKQLLEFLRMSQEVSIEETRTASALAFLFDHFGLKLLQAFLREIGDGVEDLPLNAMVGKIVSVVLYFSGFCSCLNPHQLCCLISMIISWFC
jgi:kinesin family protein C2/C3